MAWNGAENYFRLSASGFERPRPAKVSTAEVIVIILFVIISCSNCVRSTDESGTVHSVSFETKYYY